MKKRQIERETHTNTDKERRELFWKFKNVSKATLRHAFSALKTQLHAVNARWKRLSQLSFSNEIFCHPPTTKLWYEKLQFARKLKLNSENPNLVYEISNKNVNKFHEGISHNCNLCLKDQFKSKVFKG